MFTLINFCTTTPPSRKKCYLVLRESTAFISHHMWMCVLWLPYPTNPLRYVTYCHCIWIPKVTRITRVCLKKTTENVTSVRHLQWVCTNSSELFCSIHPISTKRRRGRYDMCLIERKMVSRTLRNQPECGEQRIVSHLQINYQYKRTFSGLKWEGQDIIGQLTPG